MARDECPESVTDGHRRAGDDGRLDRLICRAQPVGMLHAHDAAPGHRAGEDHGAAARGPDGRTRCGRQVNPAVPGQPRLGRRREPAHDGRRTVERPPVGRSRRIGRSRPTVDRPTIRARRTVRPGAELAGTASGGAGPGACGPPPSLVAPLLGPGDAGTGTGLAGAASGLRPHLTDPWGIAAALVLGGVATLAVGAVTVSAVLAGLAIAVVVYAVRVLIGALLDRRP